MILSIITINLNNLEGLKKTLASVASQTCKEFEHIIVDGASTDGSIELIRDYANGQEKRVKWLSERDSGIYNAMNKGIQIASGDYLEFLNSGDCLAADDIVKQMYNELDNMRYPSILYGNMLKRMRDGSLYRDKCFAGGKITLLGMYKGCLNHSPAYISRALFDKYGLYDESLKICSDWKWYLQAIVLGEEEPLYTNKDITVFDMNGISESNKSLLEQERNNLLKELIQPGILADYNKWYNDIRVMERLKRYPAVYSLFRFIERCLFKIDKKRSNRVHGYE